MANKKGTGLMLVAADIPADKEADFNKWYQEEHLQELMGVPGVLNAARYEATKSGPKHLAVYELESVDVINTDAFKNRPRTPIMLLTSRRRRSISSPFLPITMPGRAVLIVIRADLAGRSICTRLTAASFRRL